MSTLQRLWPSYKLLSVMDAVMERLYHSSLPLEGWLTFIRPSAHASPSTCLLSAWLQHSPSPGYILHTLHALQVAILHLSPSYRSYSQALMGYSSISSTTLGAV